MNKNVFEYLEEINQEHSTITSQPQNTQEKSKKHSKEKSISKENTLGVSEEIEKIKEMPIVAQLSDVIKYIADDWGIPSSDINVTYHTGAKYYADNMEIAQNAVTRYNFYKNNKQPNNVTAFYFQLRGYKNGQEKTTVLSCLLNYDSVQKDGRCLRDHVQAYSYEETGSRLACMDLQIDNIYQLLLTYKLKNLVSEVNKNGENFKFKPTNKTTTAILMASDYYKHDQLEMAE